MSRGLRATRMGVLGAIATVFIARALPSCGDRFEPACRVTSREIVLPAGATEGNLDALAEGNGGDIVVLSLVGDARRADAGAPDGGDAGDGGDGGDGGDAPPAAFTAPALSVVVVAAGGTAPRLVHTFPPPRALVARRDSTDSVGATFAGEGALFHWNETSRATAADGTRTTSVASKRQHVDLAGGEGTVFSDPDLACTRCGMLTIFAVLGATTAAIVRQEPDASAPLSAKGSTRLVAFDPIGRKTTSVDLASLLGGDSSQTGAPASGSPALGNPSASLRLYARAGRFVARVGLNVALFDEGLALRAGPWALPSSGAEIDTALGDLDIAWVGALSSPDAGPGANVGELPDLLLESRRTSGPPRIAPVRISTTGRASLVRRNEERVGVLHAAEGTSWFTLVGEDGRKRGGDLALPTARGPSSSASDREASGPTLRDPAGAQLLFAVDRTHFVVWSTRGDLTRETITCDP